MFADLNDKCLSENSNVYLTPNLASYTGIENHNCMNNRAKLTFCLYSVSLSYTSLLADVGPCIWIFAVEAGAARKQSGVTCSVSFTR